MAGGGQTTITPPSKVVYCSDFVHLEGTFEKSMQSKHSMGKELRSDPMFI